ncbi:hypothetical protein BB559_003065 [Furculomyces boomerangus]|uniref:Uncharacterized protein n=2 Tax=Harpellales TaxID=61421 RepID=A0A2T9YP78_9FUNG|nr:hypothetical protein BB559_003065 [Furculomyces boomerangus]PVZ96587.1 hypothetical protein BB558_007496 [Smittium angustum]PVZ97319.1 hypothetical protein BB558_006728 [Smittium angustum]
MTDFSSKRLIPWSKIHNRYTTAKNSAINVVNFDNSGDYLFFGGQDRLLNLYNVDSGKLIKSYEGHRREILDIYIEESSKKVASCGGDKIVYLWDIERGDIPRKYYGHTQRINTVTMNKEGSLLLSGSYDTTVRIFDLRSRNKSAIQILTDAKDSISTVIINDNQILSGSVDGYLRTYDVRSGQLFEDCISEAITCIYESSDNNCVLVTSLDNKIRLFDKSDGSLLNTYQGHTASKYRIKSCLDVNDEIVVSGSEDGNIYFWNMLQASVLGNLSQHTNIVNSVSVSKNNKYLASSSINGELIVWS